MYNRWRNVINSTAIVDKILWKTNRRSHQRLYASLCAVYLIEATHWRHVIIFRPMYSWSSTRLYYHTPLYRNFGGVKGTVTHCSNCYLLARMAFPNLCWLLQNIFEMAAKRNVSRRPSGMNSFSLKAIQTVKLSLNKSTQKAGSSTSNQRLLKWLSNWTLHLIRKNLIALHSSVLPTVRRFWFCQSLTGKINLHV